MPRAWITGSRGFVGSALRESLFKNGFNVVAVTNSESFDANTIHVDFGCGQSIREAVDAKGVPNILFHLGWGKVYEPQSSDHLGQNLEDTKVLLNELYKLGMDRAIFVGSSSEYGSREGSLKESDAPVGRLTNYAQGKIAACEIGFELARLCKKIFIHIRLFHTLGAINRQNSLIRQLYKSYLESREIGLTSCDQFRDYIHLDDAVEGMIRISRIASSEIVNLGSGRKTQLREMIEMFWKGLGAPGELLRFGAHQRPGHEPVQPPCYADLVKLKAMTNWAPSLSLEEGISKTISELEK